MTKAKEDPQRDLPSIPWPGTQSEAKSDSDRQTSTEVIFKKYKLVTY